MSKVGPFMSFARWILTSNGLIRYMHPSDEELRQIALVPLVKERKKTKRQDKNGGSNGFDSNTFNVLKQNDLQLETTKVTLADVVQLRYFTEYQWLLDFTFYAIIVYALTEVSKNASHFLPKTDFLGCFRRTFSIFLSSLRSKLI